MRSHLYAILLPAFCLIAVPGALRAQEDDIVTAQEIGDIFKKLQSEKFEERWSATQEVLDLDRTSLPALTKRLGREHKASGESMKRIVYALRKKLKEQKIKYLLDRGKKATPDNITLETPSEFLEILIREKRDDNIIAWRSAAEVMTILIAMTSMATTEALLAVLDFCPEHEAAFRKEIYQLMLWSEDGALPAMVLRKKSKDEDIQVVVSAYLEKMNMERPGQQVQVKNPSILAEILLIFGKKKDFDSVDVIAPFLNADNPIVRKAARDSILMFDKSAIWTLRKEYKNYTNEDPDSAWSADEIAARLFSAQDDDRLAPLNEKMQKGLQAAKEKKFDEMETTFRGILALQPLYERKTEMVPGYMEAARYNVDRGNLEKASFLLRTARRLNADSEKADKILAMFYYVEGLRSLEDGIADPELMKKALGHDPAFEDAKSKLRDIEKIYRGRKIKGYRMLAAGGIGATALLLLLIIILKKL